MRARLTPDPASFRDPAGRVYLGADRVIRSVTERGAAGFDAVLSSGVLRSLTDKGLVIATDRLSDAQAEAVSRDLPPGDRPAYFLEHPRIGFISYPYEWGFETLRSAALRHLDVHLALLKAGFTLSDGSAFNMQIGDGGPYLIDVLSIVPYVEGEHWKGYAQFQRQFLNPLFLEAWTGVSFAPFYRSTLDGISSDDVTRLLPWSAFLRPSVLINAVAPALVDRRAAKERSGRAPASPAPIARSRMVSLIEQLKRTVAGLRIRTRTTPWLDYEDNNSYSDGGRQAKHDAIAAFVAEAAPGVLVDVGCNTGEYAQLALEHGAARVVGLETDRAALDAAFRRASARKLAFLPLAIDILNPSPDQGWRGVERSALSGRLKADAMLGLAVIHHMAIARNIPLGAAVDCLIGLAPRGVIEFVPKSDPQVQRLLRFREDIFVDYTLEAFRAHVAARAAVVSETPLAGSDRVLFSYRRSS